MPIEISNGPTTYKGIELLPIGTKVKLNDETWTITKHNKHSYRLEYKSPSERVTARAYVAYEKTEMLRSAIVPAN